ncbi:WD-repeat protein [Trichosporon asahii var. asahii CBS 8904]|uniref:WD-repeat protein n=1 Tax=Trichosporon asahii var. asahii (strain CBS 8904) TaxID=1220162 RepID=K1VUY2_TRIAC|nr:WD-repeat protein [Trichosporon asahii var. asahii CBS 8904]
MSGWPEDDPFDEDFDPDYVPGYDEDDDFAEYADDAAELWALDDEDVDELDEDMEDMDDMDEEDMDGLAIPGTYVTHTRLDVEDEDEDEEEESEGGTYDYTPVRLLELAALINSASNMPEDHRSTLVRQLMRHTHISAPRRRKPRRWWKVQTEPDPRGLALLRSGEFGPVGPWVYSAPPPVMEREDPRVRKHRRKNSEEEDKKGKEKAPAPKRRKRPSERHYRQHLPRTFMYAHASRELDHPVIPNTNGTIVARYPCVPYVGQFCGPNDSIFCKLTC